MNLQPEAAIGLHVIADLACAGGLSDLPAIEDALRAGAAAGHARVLEVRLHHFGQTPHGAEGGVTGVALLAESHISIHTWPEHGLVAVDIFMCGGRADPLAALDTIAARMGARIITQQAIPRLAHPALAGLRA
ncbi:adenosylmethionine decarboxylase [Novosphingobium sp. FSY-8]|uniref:Adenosylmethionine decarboxylase n=1 Tax=Novosphingobium ovatum TaxID=1908523 RepID=A0ABW9XDY1_9SPHN|nr:adenosylmethionine decarboxylase [Novosphingobium ovatum]NBC36753.1 adenosylmethionine decarboxylase [Novosphingobium ovatum]